MIRNLSTFVLVLGFSLIVVYYYPHLTIAPGDIQGYHKKYENECLTCHQPMAGVPNRACLECHEGFPAEKRIEVKKSAHIGVSLKELHAAIGTQPCYECHPEHTFSKEKIRFKFDHSSDQAGNCSSCHIRPEDKMHRSAMDCDSCHKVKSWKGARFVHADMNEKCEDCHTAPGDSFHRSLVGGCGSCHTSRSWQDADFDHSRFFLLRGHHKAKCEKCHVGSRYAEYTCYGCHEHSEAGVLREHRGMGVPFEKCTDCHRDSSEKKARRRLKEIWGQSDSKTHSTPARKKRHDDDD